MAEQFEQLRCLNCSSEFLRVSREVRRQEKKGKTRFFCSQSCRTSFQMKLNPRPNLLNIARHDNRRDEFTPFRWYLLRAKGKRQSSHGQTNLTLSYLKDLWESQGGRCPLTGWELVLPDTTNGWKEGLTPRSASLDRMDNSLGYYQGNVRFIAVMANWARNRFTDEDLLEFCRSVARECRG